jgi:integrase
MERLLLQQSAAYIQFINSLRSKDTKIHYTNWLNDFLKYLNISCDRILDFDSNQLQQKIINYVIDMRDTRNLSPSSIRSHISAIQTFLVINDFEGINWTKVKKFVGEFYKVADDRPYTRDEIKQLVDAAHSLRDKAIILLLSSSGLRVGGLVRLQLKHLIPNDKYGIYQIDVYKKSREAYTAFCTPETRVAIDLYLNWRRKLGETVTPESPLFRVEFDTRFGASAPAKQIDRALVCRMLKMLRYETGIVKIQHLTESVKRGKPRSHIKTLHGMRKYLSTCLETEGVNAVYVDLLLGHNLGLKSVYSKPTPTQLLEGNGDKVLGYIHGIDALTINEENRLMVKVKSLTERQDEMMLIKVKHEEEMKTLRKEMENKFQEIFAKIDINALK